MNRYFFTDINGKRFCLDVDELKKRLFEAYPVDSVDHDELIDSLKNKNKYENALGEVKDIFEEARDLSTCYYYTYFLRDDLFNITSGLSKILGHALAIFGDTYYWMSFNGNEPLYDDFHDKYNNDDESLKEKTFKYAVCILSSLYSDDNKSFLNEFNYLFICYYFHLTGILCNSIEWFLSVLPKGLTITEQNKKYLEEAISIFNPIAKEIKKQHTPDYEITKVHTNEEYFKKLFTNNNFYTKNQKSSLNLFDLIGRFSLIYIHDLNTGILLIFNKPKHKNNSPSYDIDQYDNISHYMKNDFMVQSQQRWELGKRLGLW